MADPLVFVIASDESLLSLLEMTVRLGGYRPVIRRSLGEAQRQRVDDSPPHAVLVELGDDATPDEIGAARRLRDDIGVPVIVILPETLAREAANFTASGLRVLTRPYAPSALYAALAGEQA